MKRLQKLALLAAAILTTAGSWAQVPLQVTEGTPIAVRPAQEISSATAHTGDIVRFRVMRPVRLNDTLLIAAGADAYGTITNAEHSKAFGRSGRLELTVDRAQAVDGTWVRVHCRAENSGANQTALVAGAVVFVSVFGALIQGHEAVVPMDQEIDVLVANTQPIAVAGAPAPLPVETHGAVSSLVVCQAVGADSQPVAPNNSFPISPALMLWCTVQPPPDDQSFEVRLYQGENMVNHSLLSVRSGAQRVWTPLFPQGGGFTPGRYRVEVVLNGIIQATQAFSVN